MLPVNKAPELPTEGSSLYTYMLALPAGHQFIFDLGDMVEAPADLDGMELQFVITKQADDGWSGLPYGNELSSTADVIDYIKDCVQDDYINISNGKDPRRVKKEIAYGFVLAHKPHIPIHVRSMICPHDVACVLHATTV